MSSRSALSPLSDPGGLERSRDSHLRAVALVVFALALAALTWPTLTWLARTWAVHPYYSHGPLLPLAAAWLVWRSRASFGAAEPSVAGAAALVGGIVVAAWAVPHEAHLWAAAAAVVCFVGAAGVLAGRTGLRAALFPAGLVLLAIPVPLAERAAPLLAGRVAEWAADAAGLVGVAVLRSGVQLTVADGSYTVGGPCSGLRSLLALVSLAYVAAGLARADLPRRAVLVAVALPLALAANWIRLTGLLILTDGFGARTGLSVFEGPASPLLFGLALAVLFALAWRLEDREPEAEWVQTAVEEEAESLQTAAAGEAESRRHQNAPPPRQRRWSPARRGAAMLLLAALVALVLAVAGRRAIAAPKPVTPLSSVAEHVLYTDVAGWYERTADEVAVLSPFDLSLTGIAAELPYDLGDWRGVDRPLGDDIGRWLADPDVAMTRTYVRGDGAVVWLSAFGSRGDKSFHLFEHTPLTCYPLSGWRIESMERTPVEMGPRPLTVELGRAVSDEGELAFATMYVWGSPARDPAEGVISLRLAVPVRPGQSWNDARDVLVDDFLRRLFVGTLGWSAF